MHGASLGPVSPRLYGGGVVDFRQGKDTIPADHQTGYEPVACRHGCHAKLPAWLDAHRQKAREPSRKGNPESSAIQREPLRNQDRARVQTGCHACLAETCAEQRPLFSGRDPLRHGTAVTIVIEDHGESMEPDLILGCQRGKRHLHGIRFRCDADIAGEPPRDGVGGRIIPEIDGQRGDRGQGVILSAPEGDEAEHARYQQGGSQTMNGSHGPLIYPSEGFCPRDLCRA